jgi:hypoxanthine phosphoribosyltransferase
MKEIKIHDKTFVEFIPEKKILEAVDFLAEQVRKDTTGKPVFIIVLKGGLLFGADFAKAYNGDAVFDFIRLKSYSGTESTGKVEVILNVHEQLEGKEVYVLEDIVDTGHTLEKIREILKNKHPKYIKIVTLFYKPDSYVKDFPVDFVGIKIPNKFIVGYGLDYDEEGRNLRDVYQLKTE